MRLSLMKAAHADVGGGPVQEIRIRGTKTAGEAHQRFYLKVQQTYGWAATLNPQLLAQRMTLRFVISKLPW
jgi:hypothetical protein